MGNDKAYPAAGRVILHIDMNAFYCSVHEAVEPDKYKGQPLAVAGSVELRRGVIVTSSYAARSKGVRTGMLVNQAMKLCPDLIILSPDFDLYREFSRRFMTLAGQYSPLLEAVSIDECYIDITGSKLFGHPRNIAAKLQAQIREQLGLPCSIGIAPNKLLAKMASDMKKPNGISILRIRDVPKLLWPKPCNEMYGIGRRTAEKLSRMNIRTIGQLAAADEHKLKSVFGVYGEWLKQAANGIDHSPVNPVREQSKSIGHTTTLPTDFTQEQQIKQVFLNLSDQVCRRLRRQKLYAQTIQITIRDPDMKTITRSCTLPAATRHAADVHREACRLFREHWPAGKPVRLLGVTLQNLTAEGETAVQLDLFDYKKEPVKHKLDETLDHLRDKFGENAVLMAGMLTEDPSALIRDHKRRGTSLQMDHLRAEQQDSAGPDPNTKVPYRDDP